MMSSRVVVVWEWENRSRRWRPYSPEVSQHLERAYAKNLTMVYLSDADPTLDKYYINLTTKQQHFDESDALYNVRRNVYSLHSPAGKGAKWEWEGDDNQWRTYDMDVQCLVESAWSAGEQTIDISKTRLGFPYIINFCNLTQVRSNTGYVRNIRRVQQAPYPLVKLTPAEIATYMASMRPTNQPQTNDQQSGKPKKNKIKQTLMNMFGSHSHDIKNSQPVEDGPYAEATLNRNGRRPSVDTVSTYLSHDTASRGTVAESLDSSEDDVFDKYYLQSAPVNRPRSRSSRDSHRKEDVRRRPITTVSGSLPPSERGSSSDGYGQSSWPLANRQQKKARERISPREQPPMEGAIVGVDPASQMISYHVAVVKSSHWGETTCPICLCELFDGQTVSVALLGCQHCLHLTCLNSLLNSQPSPVMYIQCPVCQRIYGEKHGNQPPGSMECSILNFSLPGHTDCRTIQIVYNFTSGIQGAEHPSPGRPYYAVGFPRTCFLPDDHKGRLVMDLLKVAFERRLVFTIGRSVTTGREDVITWNEIHHKTEPGTSRTGHGYPDPHFLDNCLAELALQGVVSESSHYQQLQ